MTDLSSAALAALIDHAVLQPTHTERDLETACAIARAERVATVCVKPFHVSAARRLLTDSGVGVSTVIGFPHGGDTSAAKHASAEVALGEGAIELDMVINIGALLGGDYAVVEGEIAAIAKLAHTTNAIVKTILECAYLSDAQKTTGAEIAVAAGADFVKTSTGFGPSGATVNDVRLLRRTVGPAIGVKASGGIRTLDAALALVDAGANRLGMSSTAALLAELQARQNHE